MKDDVVVTVSSPDRIPVLTMDDLTPEASLEQLFKENRRAVLVPDNSWRSNMQVPVTRDSHMSLGSDVRVVNVGSSSADVRMCTDVRSSADMSSVDVGVSAVGANQEPVVRLCHCASVFS